MAITSAKLDGNKLVIEMELEDEIRDSSTGKTDIIASSSGPYKTEVILDGRPVWIVASAFLKKNVTKTSKLKKDLEEIQRQIVSNTKS